MHQPKSLKQIGSSAPGFKLPLLTGLLLALTLVGCGTSPDSGSRKPVETASHAADRLPNVRALPARDLRLRTSGGRTFLQFSATTWNNGTGPLELVIIKKFLLDGKFITVEEGTMVHFVLFCDGSQVDQFTLTQGFPLKLNLEKTIVLDEHYKKCYFKETFPRKTYDLVHRQQIISR